MVTIGIKKQGSDNSDVLLKASFCRQLFPELLQFMKDFDISEDKTGFQNSQNMHFLLQAYNYIDRGKEGGKPETDEQLQNRKDTLKKDCHWEIPDIKEAELLLAIDEYFKITSQKHNLKDLRNIMISNVTIAGSAQPYKFEDNTTKAILTYFGIPVSKDTMGVQRNAFTNFMKEAYGFSLDNADSQEELKAIKEIGFHNAFKLLRCLRNWGSHAIEGFSDDEVMRYYRFIVFTHIGITYICRRIWVNHAKTLPAKYTIPVRFDDFRLAEDRIDVIVKSNDTNFTIANCRVRFANGEERSIDQKPQNETQFTIDVRKYEPFVISFTCNNKEYVVQEKTNYYFWNPVLNILVEPPSKVSYSFKGIAGDDKDTEKFIGETFTRYAKEFRENTLTGKKILELLRGFEPTLKQLQELNNKKLSDKEAEKIDTLKKTIKDTTDEMNKKLGEGLNKVFTQVEEQSKNQKKQTKIIEEYFRSITKKIDETSSLISDIRNNEFKKERAEFIGKHIGPFVICLSSIIVLILSCLDDHSFFWIRNWKWLVPVALSIPVIAGACLWYINQTTTQPALNRLSYRYIGFALLGLTVLSLITALVMIPNKTLPSFIANYDFSKERQEGDNKKVAKLMEDYIEKKKGNDEDARIQLAKYYITFTGETDKAFSIVEPLEGESTKAIPAIAEALYAKGEDMKVQRLIDKFTETPRPPVIDRLQALLYAFKMVNVKDRYVKCDSLLKQAATYGDTEALYWLGYFRSNAQGHWTTSLKEGRRNLKSTIMNYNLITAIKYLQIASRRNYPKAAIELGNIYLDLNFIDSAKIYYNKAIALSDKEIQNEAYYKMGLLYERLDSAKNPYMDKVKAIYGPAILHTALKKPETATLYFEELEKKGGYQGYRYIPPILLYYIRTGEKSKALDLLKQPKYHSKFNEKFIDAVEALIVDDSVTNEIGKQYMRESARQCKYARMLCDFWDLQSLIKNTSTTVEGNSYAINLVSDLERIGAEIPFAYVLAAWVLKDLGSNYELSDNLAYRAIGSNHPAGALILSYLPQPYLDQIQEKIINCYNDGMFLYNNFKESWSIQEISNLFYIRTKLELALRFSPPYSICRSYLIYYGEEIDKIITYLRLDDIVKLSSEKYSLENEFERRFRFWSDVAIAINDYRNEAWMLYQYEVMTRSLQNKEFGMSYRERLLNNVLESIHLDKFPADPKMMDFLSVQLRCMPLSFRRQIKERFNDDKTIHTIINNIEKNPPYYVPQGGQVEISHMFSIFFDIMGLLNYSLLDEFSTITDGLFKLNYKIQFSEIERDTQIENKNDIIVKH